MAQMHDSGRKEPAADHQLMAQPGRFVLCSPPHLGMDLQQSERLSNYQSIKHSLF